MTTTDLPSSLLPDGSDESAAAAGDPTTSGTGTDATGTDVTEPGTVALVTLGCARNEVDSEELAGRLEAGGFRLVDDPDQAETVLVNTCGFVEAPKKDSVDSLLEAADLKAEGRARSVV